MCSCPRGTGNEEKRLAGNEGDIGLRESGVKFSHCESVGEVGVSQGYWLLFWIGQVV